MKGAFIHDVCSAKVLVRGEPNVSYICSRYYRAPELIFGATDYTCQIGKLPAYTSEMLITSGELIVFQQFELHGAF